jgi:hypothetical protein
MNVCNTSWEANPDCTAQEARYAEADANLKRLEAQQDPRFSCLPTGVSSAKLLAKKDSSSMFWIVGGAGAAIFAGLAYWFFMSKH